MKDISHAMIDACMDERAMMCPQQQTIISSSRQPMTAVRQWRSEGERGSDTYMDEIDWGEEEEEEEEEEMDEMNECMDRIG